MKFFAIILFAECFMLHYANGNFTGDKYKKMHETCVAQSECDEETIENARNGNFDPNPKFKHFLKCCFEQEEALHHDGKIHFEKVLDSFHDDLVELYEKPGNECLIEVPHSPDADALDYIYNWVYCVYGKTLEKFDIP